MVASFVPSFSANSITHSVLLAPLAPRGLSKVHSCSKITLAFWLSITISMREVAPNNKGHIVTMKQKCGLLCFFVQSYARGPTSPLRVTQGIPYSFDEDSSSFCLPELLFLPTFLLPTITLPISLITNFDQHLHSFYPLSLLLTCTQAQNRLTHFTAQCCRNLFTLFYPSLPSEWVPS